MRGEREADQSLPSAADVAISQTSVRFNDVAFNEAEEQLLL
jgi:hypothetical protein